MKLTNTQIILTLIIVVAVILRIIRLDIYPLYGDELTITYDAYSIWKTGGYDQTGDFLPITFAMGDARPPLYVYASIPFIMLFGPNEYGVRILSVISGIVLVFLMYLLGKKLFSKEVGIFAAFLIGFSPWALTLSRAGYETNFALLLSVASLLMLLYGPKNKWLYPLSALMAAFAAYTYHTYELTLPIFFAAFFLFRRDILVDLYKNKTQFFLYVGIALFVGLLIGYRALFHDAERRFFSINLMAQESLQQQIKQKINFERSIEELPLPLQIVLHNKIFENVFVFGDNYLKNFSLDYLFLHGDGNPRHNMATAGSLYLIEVITFIFGLMVLLKEQQFSKFKLILAWILIAPLATALVEQPHALRNSFMLPPLLLVSSVGWNFLWKDKWLFKSVLVVGILIQLIFILDKIYIIGYKQYNRFWSYTAKSASEFASNKKNNYDFVILSDKIDNIEFAYPTYNAIDPNLVIEQNKQRSKLGEYKFKKLGNVYIGTIPIGLQNEFIESLPGSVLYIGDITEKMDLRNVHAMPLPDKTEGYVYSESIK